MSYDDELKSIEEQIGQIAREELERQKISDELQQQMQAIKIKLARITDHRTAAKRRSTELLKERDSVTRKRDLENETKLLNDEVARRKAEVAELIRDAPWFDAAFDWQIEGAIRLPERALLGDRRGLGKTLSSIIWRRVHKVKRTLVCLRKEVAHDFVKELYLREPNVLVYNLVGKNSSDRKFAAMLLKNKEEYIVVTNIESWRRDRHNVTREILEIPYDGVILDEAHHIKSSGKATALGFFRLVEVIPKVLELTGTPIKNRPQEIFSLLHALYPSMFPTERNFLYDYCILVAPNKWMFSERGVVNLVAKIDAFYLARGPEDIGREVPPPRRIEYVLDFENYPAQKQAYKDMAERAMAVLNNGEILPVVSQLAIMTRQAQLVSWPDGIVFKYKDEFGRERVAPPLNVKESVKIDWATDLIQELTEEGERVVLFSRFKPAVYELRDRLQELGLSVAVITGDEKKNKGEIFDDFDLKTADPENYKYQVLLCTYQTVGESANFNAARHMILLDRFWNPGNDDQAIGRIDRINSVDQATIHLPQVESTIDEYMIELIEEKYNMVGDFKSAAEQQDRLRKHLEKSL